MNVFYSTVFVLIAANCYGYVVEERKSVGDDEKKIVVQSLAKFLSNEQLQPNSENDEITDDDGTMSASGEEKESAVVKPNTSFDYKPNKFVYPSDIPADAKPPFAVPPTDFRFYLKDFEVPPTLKAANSPMALQIDSNREVEQHKKAPRILSSADDDVIVDKVLPKSNYYSFFLLGHGPPPKSGPNYKWDGTIVALIYGFCGGLITLLTIIGFLTIRNVRKKMLDAEEVDYPAYGVTGPNKDTPPPTGDRNLAHSAQMYHFHHQKSQIIAMEKESKPSITRKGTESGSEEDEAVYECPGLAPVTGEMEVNNPLFHEEEIKSSKTSKEDKEKQSEADEKKKSKK